MIRYRTHEAEDPQGMRTGLVQMLFTVILFAAVIVFFILLLTRVFPAFYHQIVTLF